MTEYTARHDPRDPYYLIVDREEDIPEGLTGKLIDGRWLIKVSPMTYTFVTDGWKKS